MSKKRIKQVFEHFNSEARIFDAHILKSVPYYQEMIGVITSILPFPRKRRVDLVDIGTGTGNIAYNLKKAFPNSRLQVLDLSPNMLKVAKEKLKKFPDIEYVAAEAGTYQFTRKYDAVVSSLTLHHLENNPEKQAFHRKVYAALKPGGYFINADIVIASDPAVQATNLAR